MGADQPTLFFPLCQRAIDRFDRCPAELGEIALSHRHIDQDVAIQSFAELVAHFEQRQRKAAVDPFGRHMPDAVMPFVDMRGEEVDDRKRQLRVIEHQRAGVLPVNADERTFLNGFDLCGMGITTGDRQQPKDLADPLHLEGDALSVFRILEEAHPTRL